MVQVQPPWIFLSLLHTESYLFYFYFPFEAKSIIRNLVYCLLLWCVYSKDTHTHTKQQNNTVKCHVDFFLGDLCCRTSETRPAFVLLRVMNSFCSSDGINVSVKLKLTFSGCHCTLILKDVCLQLRHWYILNKTSTEPILCGFISSWHLKCHW